MNSLSLLTEDEVRYICSEIPPEDAINYFIKHPKDFAKILHGFRAKSLKKDQISDLLFLHRNSPFITSFIERRITRWLSQIQEYFNDCLKDLNNEELAYMHTLPKSFFAGNIPLYFKLIEKEYSQDSIALLSSAVAYIKELDEENEEARSTLGMKEKEIKHLNMELGSVKLKQKNLESKATKQFVSDAKKMKNAVQTAENTIKTQATDIKRLNTELNSERSKIKNKESLLIKQMAEISSLKSTIQEQNNKLVQLGDELASTQNIREQLEVQIRAEFEKQQTSKEVGLEETPKPKRPIDMDEFKEFLGYNLNNIGVLGTSEYLHLLKGYFCDVLFQGKPIVISRADSLLAMQCVTNILSGQKDERRLVFKDDITIEDVNLFLASPGRVVCLDNFIGYFNETELLPIFDRHRDKIIFLTIAFDRTLRYVSGDFLRYTYYFNLNRIAAFSSGVELTEDAYPIEEHEWIPSFNGIKNQYSDLLHSILKDIGFSRGYIEQRCSTISSEMALCQLLAFEVLPYCVDVLQIVPYNTSEKLIKYIGDTGHCPYKNLFKKWFV